MGLYYKNQESWYKLTIAVVSTFALDSGVDAPKNKIDMYGLRYAEFVVPMVKAVQELNEKVEDLELEILNRKSDNEMLAQRLEKLEVLLGPMINSIQ